MSILMVGTDFSTRSDRALRRALILARDGGYELMIVGVIDEVTQAEMPNLRRREAMHVLREMQRTIAHSDHVPCHVDVRQGRPSEELALAARQAGASLMVIGPHRHSLIRDAFGAVTAERIVRHTPIPVICANGIPAGTYRRILLPVDFESASYRAAQAVQTIGFVGEAEIALVHFYDEPGREMLGRALVPAAKRREYLDDCAKGANTNLRAFAVATDLQHAMLLVRETREPMSASIEQLIAEERTDLIVVSRSDKGAIGRSILGSLTEDLLRSGKCDILVIPEGE